MSWIEHLNKLLLAAGNLDGVDPASEVGPGRWHSAKPYVYDPIPKRDDLHYVGFVDERTKWDMLAASEAFVLPSRFESLSASEPPAAPRRDLS